MTRERGWLAVGALFLLAMAIAVYVVGTQLAGRTCMESGARILVPHPMLVAEPEGYGTEIPREGICRITHDGGIYTEVPLSRWDLTETAIVLATSGALLCVGWLVVAARKL